MPPPVPVSPNVLAGIGYVVLMTACFATLDASAKYASLALPLLTVIWGRYLFNFVFVAGWFAAARPGQLPRTSRPVLQVVRSLLMVGATVTFWSALRYLDLATAVAIGFAAPLLVTALSVPVLGEKVGLHRWAAVVTGFIGVMVVVRPGGAEFEWAALLPLATALFYAGYQITTRLLAATDDGMTTLVFTAAGGLVAASFLVPFGWQMLEPVDWLVVAWLGFLGAVGHYFLIQAFARAPASVIAPFTYLTIVWAAVLGYLIFGDVPTSNTVVGATIIVAAGLYVLHRENRARRVATS